MKIGLSYLSQLQSIANGWLALQFNELTALIAGGYHIEHNVDDTHAAIHASGSISEYGRTTAQGVWTEIPYAACTFSGTGTMTWTVDTTDFQAPLVYTLIGKTMTLCWNFTTTSVGGAANTTLQLAVSLRGIVPTRTIVSTFHYSDNGTFGVGIVQVVAQSANPIFTVQFIKVNGANWTGSANNTDVRGQLSFEITGV